MLESKKQKRNTLMYILTKNMAIHKEKNGISISSK